MSLQTPRCRIYQLTKMQFQHFIETPSILWDELGVVGDPAHEAWFKDVMRQSLHALDELRCTAWWLTNWPIVENARNRVIGGIGFKGPPNPDGEVEIGYGLAEAFRNKGYMTECVQAVAHWVLQQDGVKAVIAETDKDNPASEKVLSNNKFECVRETETFRYWRRTL